MTKAPLNWIKQIQETLIEAKAIPLSGHVPTFPWEKFSQKMEDVLQAPGLKIFIKKTQFLPFESIASGIGAAYIATAIDLAPLDSPCFWLMAKEDVAKLTTFALFPSNGSKGFSSPKFQEGFYYFLATQALAAIDQVQAFKDLSPKMGKFNSLPEEQALCIDVEIQHPKGVLWGRLVCPSSFHSAFKSHFSTMPPPSLLSHLAPKIDVSLKIDLGQTMLSASRWKEVAVGDFIVLDRCTFDPRSHKGTVTLVLEQTPLLRARIKENSIKIVDYAFYHEEQNPMSTDNPENEELPEEPFEQEAPLSSEFDAESEREESSLQGENHSLEKMIPAEEIPLILTVEVGRLRIPLDKLLQLSPGNVLELPVRPEQGVYLTIGGKTVAKAELIKLGEVIGVKILQVGE